MNNDLVPDGYVPDSFQIHEARGARIVIDADLAALMGVETRALNQAVKRNITRFPAGWAFQLDASEIAQLKSKSATASAGWGGRRAPPWAFTEHGVVMAASVLKSDRAVAVMKFVVEVFVEERRRGRVETKGLALQKAAGMTALSGALGERLQSFIARILDTIVDHKNQATVRDEALALIGEGIANIKERLKKTGLENEELAARAAKLLAEAEVNKAEAAKLRAETDQ